MSELTTSSLSKLAATANEAHHLARQAAESTVEYARRAGEALSEAKAHLEHGAFGDWLDTACPDISARTAQRYMRVSREWTAITSNASRVSHLESDEPQTITEALDIIATRKEPTPADRFRDWPEEKRRYLCCGHWDYEWVAKQTLILATEGCDPEEIAEICFSTPEEIDRILHPETPIRFDTWENGRSIMPDDDDCADLALRFRKSVALDLAQLRSHTAFDARYQAADEGAADATVAELERLELQYKREAERLAQWDIIRNPIYGDSLQNMALYSLSTDDARAAAGVIPEREPGEFSELFAAEVERFRPYIRDGFDGSGEELIKSYARCRFARAV